MLPAARPHCASDLARVLAFPARRSLPSPLPATTAHSAVRPTSADPSAARRRRALCALATPAPVRRRENAAPERSADRARVDRRSAWPASPKVKAARSSATAARTSDVLTSKGAVRSTARRRPAIFARSPARLAAATPTAARRLAGRPARMASVPRRHPSVRRRPPWAMPAALRTSATSSGQTLRSSSNVGLRENRVLLLVPPA